MAKFRFSLEPLLVHRRAVEDAAQRDLAKVLRQQMILQNQIRTEQQTITESKQRLTDGLLGRVDVDRVSQFARYSGQVTQRASAMVLRLASIARQIEQAREKLAEAMRQRKAIELLRQRQFEDWRRRQRKREIAQLDEAAARTAQSGSVLGVRA